jgi:mycothiol synthase
MSPELAPVTLSVDELTDFVETTDDLVPALSEHKLRRLGGAEDAVVRAWADAVGTAVLSVAALHQGDRPHWAVEVAVRRDARRPEFEAAALAVAIAEAPEPHTLWAHRPEQIVAAKTLGFREARRVVRMEGPFPEAPEHDWAAIDHLGPDEDAALIAVHNRAFAGHPEASGLTRRRLEELRGATWFDPSGVVVARRDGVVVGYCLAKLHENGDGEIYFLAVDPAVQGHGVGRALAAAACHHLRDRGARRAMLWVDGDNEAAIALYRNLGFRAIASNVELEPG